MELDKHLVDTWAEKVFIKWQNYMKHTPAKQVSIMLPLGWVEDDCSQEWFDTKYVDIFIHDVFDTFKERVYKKLSVER